MWCYDVNGRNIQNWDTYVVSNPRLPPAETKTKNNIFLFILVGGLFDRLFVTAPY